MQKVHVKKDDTVIVLSGKDRGKKGKVLEVEVKEQKVLVDGVNVKKKHTKPRPPKVPQGGILEKSSPIPCGKVMLVCSKCSRPTRVSHKRDSDGKKTRICKKCGEEI